MGSIRSLFARTPGIGWAVVGLACALMVLEVQRMPVARFVSFSMFAPLPYAVEAAAMLAIVVLYRVRGALRVSDLRAVRVTVALLSAAATWLLLYSPLADDGLALAALVLYRVATGLLLVLWGERLVPLGARRTACAFAAACLLSGLLTMVLALFSGEVARVLLGALPVAAGGLFVLYRPLVGERRARSAASPLRLLDFERPRRRGQPGRAAASVPGPDGHVAVVVDGVAGRCRHGGVHPGGHRVRHRRCGAYRPARREARLEPQLHPGVRAVRASRDVRVVLHVAGLGGSVVLAHAHRGFHVQGDVVLRHDDAVSVPEGRA